MKRNMNKTIKSILMNSLLLSVVLILSGTIFTQTAEADELKIDRAEFNATKGELEYETQGGKYITFIVHKEGTENMTSIGSDPNKIDKGVITVFDFRRDALINDNEDINGTYKWVFCLKNESDLGIRGNTYEDLISCLRNLQSEGSLVFVEGTFTYASVSRLSRPQNVRIISKDSSNFFLTFDKVENASEYGVIRKDANGSVHRYLIGSYNEMMINERGEYCVVARSGDLTKFLDTKSSPIIFDPEMSTFGETTDASELPQKKDDSRSSDSSSGTKTTGSFAPVNMTKEEKAGWDLVSREPTTFNFSDYSDNIQAIRGYNAYQGPLCRAAFQMAAPGYSIGNTFQIDYSQYESQSGTKVLTSGTGVLSKPMTITISIPRKLQKPGRKYEVVCVARDGRAVLLPTTMNGEDRLTFSTLYLNAFGLMYKD